MLVIINLQETEVKTKEGSMGEGEFVQGYSCLGDRGKLISGPAFGCLQKDFLVYFDVTVFVYGGFSSHDGYCFQKDLEGSDDGCVFKLFKGYLFIDGNRSFGMEGAVVDEFLELLNNEIINIYRFGKFLCYRLAA